MIINVIKVNRDEGYSETIECSILAPDEPGISAKVKKSYDDYVKYLDKQSKLRLEAMAKAEEQFIKDNPKPAMPIRPILNKLVMLGINAPKDSQEYKDAVEEKCIYDDAIKQFKEARNIVVLKRNEWHKNLDVARWAASDSIDLKIQENRVLADFLPAECKVLNTNDIFIEDENENLD